MADPKQTRQNGRKWWKPVFALSLALNFLVLGAVVGLVLSGGPGREERPGRDLRAAGRLPTAMMLPHGARDDLRAKLRSSPVSRQQIRAAERDLMGQVNAVLRAEPLDAAALAVLFAERRALRQSRSEFVDAALIEVLAGMSPQERAEFAERMKRHKGRKDHPSKETRAKEQREQTPASPE